MNYSLASTAPDMVSHLILHKFIVSDRVALSTSGQILLHMLSTCTTVSYAALVRQKILSQKE